MTEWLPEDHLVWFLLEVVEQLDTTAFHARRRLGGSGREDYDPDMLLGLLLYAYAVGERSSRRIERLCVDHVAFRVMCAQDAPDHSTIARFRSEHEAAFAGVFAQVVRLCAAAGMVRVGTVSIDGTKIAANASRGANRGRDTVRDEARRIAEDIVAEAARVDEQEDAAQGAGSRDDDLPPGFAEHSGRAANIKKALEELARQDAEDAEADEADRAGAEGFLARVEAGEPIPGPAPAGVNPVRVQRARVARWQRILADLEDTPGHAASRRRSDAVRWLKRAEQRLGQAEADQEAGTVDRRGRSARQRDRRDRKSRARGGAGRVVNVTDPDSRLMTEGSGGGSVQGYNAQAAVTDDHLILGIHVSQDANDANCYTPTLTAAIQATVQLGVTIGTVLADAGYFTDDNLTATGPDRLIAPGKNREVTAAAKADPVHEPPPPEASPKDAMRHRLRDPGNAEHYKRRSATVEPVFAHLKDLVGLRRFSRRGLQAVTAELNLAATVVNLGRLHHTTKA